MQKIAKAAIKLSTAPNAKVVAIPAGKGLTELSGFTTNSDAIIDVIVRDYPGTQTPNPNQALAADIQSNFNSGNNDPKNGPFADNEVDFIAPGGDRYPFEATAPGIYAVDKYGWTGIASGIKGQNNNVDDLLSGTIDTADQNYYAVDDSYNSVGPVGTAKNVVSVAEDLLPVIVDSLR
jgi:hypothetical protein